MSTLKQLHLFSLKNVHYTGFYIWKKIDSDKAAIRLVTSWATPESVVDQFIKDLKRL